MKAQPFRFYDKDTKEMLYPMEAAKAGLVVSAFGKVLRLTRRGLELQPNIVLMRATGTINHMAQTIYEADIIDLLWQNEFGSIAVQRGFVKWNEDSAMWDTEVPLPSVMCPPDMPPEGLVVGNLYQHPELLKEQPDATKYQLNRN